MPAGLNFTGEQFCDAVVKMTFVILDILHIGFTITSSNGKTIEYIVRTLLGFLQVKCQGIEEGPFTTHSKTMLTAIVSLLMYVFMAYGMELLTLDLPGRNNPTYPFQCMVFFGNMSMASLSSIFFPDSMRPALYVLCVLISAGELLYWVYHQRDQELIFTRQIHALWIWLFGYFSMEQRDILPRFRN